MAEWRTAADRVHLALWHRNWNALSRNTSKPAQSRSRDLESNRSRPPARHVGSCGLGGTAPRVRCPSAQLFVQAIEQCFGFHQIGGVEAFGEASEERA